jgi:putative (di)nucleoside polyphosphate hydrolase
MILLGPDNKIFVGQRRDQPTEIWQMPQGGIAEAEIPDHAMLRELKEEISTHDVEILAQSEKWYTYDLPPELAIRLWEGKFRGQKQRWYLLRFLGQDEDININTSKPEFRAWKWVDQQEVIDLVSSFKKEMYRQVLEDLWSFS